MEGEVGAERRVEGVEVEMAGEMWGGLMATAEAAGQVEALAATSFSGWAQGR